MEKKALVFLGAAAAAAALVAGILIGYFAIAKDGSGGAGERARRDGDGHRSSR